MNQLVEQAINALLSETVLEMVYQHDSDLEKLLRGADKALQDAVRAVKQDRIYGAMRLRDAADLEELAGLVRQKRLFAAAKLVRNLDTAVRDVIPRRLFNKLWKIT